MGTICVLIHFRLGYCHIHKTLIRHQSGIENAVIVINFFTIFAHFNVFIKHKTSICLSTKSPLVLNDVEKALGDKVTILKVNFDENKELTEKFNIYFFNTRVDVNNIEIISSENNEYIKNVIIYNTVGELVYSTDCIENHISIDFSNYANGVYFVKINTNNNYQTYKIIKI